MQLPGLLGRGITSMELHEISVTPNQSTWPVVSVAAAPTAKLTVAGESDLVAFIQKVVNNRKDP